MPMVKMSVGIAGVGIGGVGPDAVASGGAQISQAGGRAQSAQRVQAARTAQAPQTTAAADPALAALAAIAGHEQVRQAQEALRQASAELRWHPALRRRWREARAEASIRSAVASASIEGVRIPAQVLREHVAAASLDQVRTGDPGLDAAGGLWRAQARIVTWMPDLVGQGRPALPGPRALLTSLHRDVVGPLATSGQIDVGEVALPRAQDLPREGGPGVAPTGAQLDARREGLAALIAATQVPALVRAAVVHAEMLSARPFSLGNAAVGRLLVRHLITIDALEPTGTAVTDLYAARAPGAYADAAAAYASGTLEGVVAWVVWQAEAIMLGIQEAGELCRAVQAGTWQAG